MKIRLEEEKDYLEVKNLVRDSFWNVYRPGAWEHYIVHNLRDDPSFVKELAYVIEKDGKIIGHINYSYGTISDDNEKLDGLVLGPISISEDCQNQGYGTKLINYTLKLVEDKDIPFIFVIGDENYYQKFGFESASKYNLFLEGTSHDEECPFFMVKIFSRNEIDFKDAIFSNPEVFDVDENDVAEFDKKFEYKQKKVHEGQLSEMIK